jgi:acetyl-CoA C-acetyltransferase
MIIRSGLFDRVVVEAHSKASDMVTYPDILMQAFDPIWHKPLGGDPHFLAGLEMASYMRATGASEEDCARVVVKNRGNAHRNPMASYESRITADEVMRSPKVSDPLKHLDIAPLADGCVVFVLANRRVARGDRLVRVAGLGWAEDTPFPESRAGLVGDAAAVAVRQAARVARIEGLAGKLDLAEVDDQFAFKELQHLEALGLAPAGRAHEQAAHGRFDADGQLPVNVSGGSLGVGNLLEAKGAARALEVVTQLRGEAGARQVEGARLGLAHAWRGLPTASHAVAVFEAGGGGK